MAGMFKIDIHKVIKMPIRLVFPGPFVCVCVCMHGVCEYENIMYHSLSHLASYSMLTTSSYCPVC